MPIKQTPPRRIGIVTVPGRVTVSRPSSRPFTDKEGRAIAEILSAPRPLTFDDFVRSTEDLARRIVIKHGGVDRTGWTKRKIDAWTAHHHGSGYVTKAGYLVPGHVKEASELAYALEVLWLILFARSNDIDEARRCAWMAGLLAQEAAMKFRWEKHVLRSELIVNAARRGGAVRAAQAREQSLANEWLREVESRPAGRSAENAYRIIARKTEGDPRRLALEPLRPGSVKKAVLRARKRAASVQGRQHHQREEEVRDSADSRPLPIAPTKN